MHGENLKLTGPVCLLTLTYTASHI